MCLNSSGLRSTDNIKFESDSVDVFLDTCVTDGENPFKNDFHPNTYVPTIEQMQGSGGKLIIHSYGSIAYSVQTDDGSKVTINVNSRPYVPNLNFRLLALQHIATDRKNNELPEHERTKKIINASSSIFLLDNQMEKNR